MSIFPAAVYVRDKKYEVKVGEEGFPKEYTWGQGLHEAQFAVLKNLPQTAIRDQLGCKDRFLGAIGWYKWRVILIGQGDQRTPVYINVKTIAKQSEWLFYKIDVNKPVTQILSFMVSNTKAVHMWLTSLIERVGRQVSSSSQKQPTTMPRNPLAATWRPELIAAEIAELKGDDEEAAELQHQNS